MQRVVYVYQDTKSSSTANLFVKYMLPPPYGSTTNLQNVVEDPNLIIIGDIPNIDGRLNGDSVTALGNIVEDVDDFVVSNIAYVDGGFDGNPLIALEHMIEGFDHVAVEDVIESDCKKLSINVMHRYI